MKRNHGYDGLLMVCVIFTISSHGRQYYVISKDFWKYVNIDLKHKGALPQRADMTKKSFSRRWIMTNSSNELAEKWRQEVLTRKNTTISLKSTTYASSSSSSLSCKPEKEMHKKEILKLNFAFALLSLVCLLNNDEYALDGNDEL